MPALAHVAAGKVVGVRLAANDGETATTVAGEAAPKDPSPLTVAPKELFWSLGSFLVLLALMRLVLYPRLRRGMDARQAQVTDRASEAEAIKNSAQSDIDEYSAALAAVRAEAQERVDLAARTVEAERLATMSEVNGEVARQRSAAMSDIEAAKTAVAGHVSEAARDVAGDLVRRVLGEEADAAAVAAGVERAMSAGVGR
jgi:F-type H+-transporting ATPase subunit b